jgi:hypothetical protein
MKKIILSFGTILFCFFGVSFSSQIEECKNTTETVNLLKIGDSKLIVYETNRVIMKFGLNDFKPILKDDSVVEHHTPDLLRNIEKEEKKSKEILLSSFVKKGSIAEERVERAVASLILQGKADIYNKKNASYLTSVTVEHSCEQYVDGGAFGKLKFKLSDGSVFFENVNVIISG